jgi:hypothetical protein
MNSYIVFRKRLVSRRYMNKYPEIKLNNRIIYNNYSAVQHIKCFHEKPSHIFVYEYIFFLIAREQVSLKYMQFCLLHLCM